ncbi:hypothetical protein [Streptomyces olivoreticuli]|uniref:hypothetical protein n=1 Tax=Streptomyces olivoreticuli TaxID=68246 RepID=UPI000E238D95|nr:hypothetical protein [Streptomyces olivoreticuli]
MGRVTVVEDLAFGEITITLDTAEGFVEVNGGWLPRTMLRRDPGKEPTAWPPIGTSDPDALTLTLDGEGGSPTLGRGYVNRRTYTVRFPDGGRTYRLVPYDETQSCLMRDKDRLGKLLVSPGGGHVAPATWRSASKVLPVEAALGYAWRWPSVREEKRPSVRAENGPKAAAAQRWNRYSTYSRPGRNGRTAGVEAGFLAFDHVLAKVAKDPRWRETYDILRGVVGRVVRDVETGYAIAPRGLVPRLTEAFARHDVGKQLDLRGR